MKRLLLWPFQKSHKEFYNYHWVAAAVSFCLNPAITALLIIGVGLLLLVQKLNRGIEL